MQAASRRQMATVVAFTAFALMLAGPRLFASDSGGAKPAPPPAGNATPTSGPLAWSIDPPVSTWNLTHNQAIEFVVTVADSSISRVLVTHSTLTDSDASRAIVIPSSAFRICSEKDSDANCNGTLKAPDQRIGATAYKATLWLKVDADKVPNGSFAGTLTLATNGANDSKTLSLTLQHSSSRARVIGLMLLAAGVALAWFVTVFARSRVNRDQALLPVALLVQKLESLRSQLALLTTFAMDLKVTGPAIDSALQDLSVANLDAKQLLPPVVTGLTQSTSSQLTAYQQFLQRESQIVENLTIIVAGIESAAAVLPAAPRPADLHGLVEKIDALSGTLPQDSAALRNQVKALIDSYNSTPGPRALAEAQPAPHSVDGPIAMNVATIGIEIRTIGLLAWIVWGLVSVLVGFTILINSTPGFGVSADYIRCFLWGLGLPVAGQGLQQLTMSSVNSQLGITLPK